MLENAIQALRRGEHATAAEVAEAVLLNDPGNVDALHLQGLARLGLGQHEAARASFEQALARAPDRSDVHMAMASLSMASGQMESAMAAASAAAEADPNHLPAYVALAHMALARGDLDEAARLVKLAELVSPDHPQTLLARGNLAQTQGDDDSALRLLTRVVEQLPEDALALSSLGLFHLRTGNHAFAEQSLRRALEVDGASRRLRWALVSALRRQGRLEDALAEVEHLCAARRDPWALAQRAGLSLELGRLDPAVADYRDLLLAAKLEPNLLGSILRGFAVHAQPGGATVLVEELLAAHPDSDLLWRVRLGMANQLREDTAALAERWLKACPNSAEALQHDALRREAGGDLDGAEAAADKALALRPDLEGAHLVKLRAELRHDPRQALEHAQVLLDSRQEPGLRRNVWRWHGLAADRLDDVAVAAQSWAAMVREPVSSASIPGLGRGEQDEAGASTARVAGSVEARLLWGLPGASVMQVVEWLRASPGVTLVDDRFGPRPRPDGFNAGRIEMGPVDGDLPRWVAGIGDYGLTPEEVVDWLPHWNRDVDAGLPDARLVAVLRDPRDLLLNWWVFGSAQKYAFPGVEFAAQWLAAVLGELADRIQAQPESTLALRVEDAIDDGAAADLAAIYRIDPAKLGPPPALLAGQGGHAARFPAGHWRRYETVLGEAFAHLAAVAGRLGY